MPKAAYKIGESPPNTFPGQTLLHMGIRINVEVVVEVNKPVAEGREEHAGNEDKEQKRNGTWISPAEEIEGQPPYGTGRPVAWPGTLYRSGPCRDLRTASV